MIQEIIYVFYIFKDLPRDVKGDGKGEGRREVKKEQLGKYIEIICYMEGL
jgi:hypothetical protein